MQHGAFRPRSETGAARGLLVGPLKRPPRRVFADDLAHPQQRRVDPIAADRADVRVAAMSSQQAQQQGAQHVAHRRLMGAVVVERTIGDPVVKQLGSFEKLDEVGHLPVGGHRLRPKRRKLRVLESRLFQRNSVHAPMACSTAVFRINGI